MRVAVLVPRRSGEPHRDRAWRWLQDRWACEHPDWPVVEGHHDDGGPFNRSAAINEAAEAAGPWDVAVVADSDSFVDPARLVEAVEAASATGKLVVGFELRAHVRQEMTEQILTGFAGPWEPGVADWLAEHCSGMIAVPHSLWTKVGGFDARFAAPGAEDVAFAVAATDLGGGRLRVPGTLWHLWHPIREASTDANNELLGRYLAAHQAFQAGHRDAYRPLLGVSV